MSVRGRRTDLGDFGKDRRLTSNCDGAGDSLFDAANDEPADFNNDDTGAS